MTTEKPRARMTTFEDFADLALDTSDGLLALEGRLRRLLDERDAYREMAMLQTLGASLGPDAVDAEALSRHLSNENEMAVIRALWRMVGPNEVDAEALRRLSSREEAATPKEALKGDARMKLLLAIHAEHKVRTGHDIFTEPSHSIRTVSCYACACLYAEQRVLDEAERLYFQELLRLSSKEKDGGK